MEEESLKNFINSTIFLVKLFAGLKDKFLAQKLYDKISGFIAGYIRLFNSKREEEDASHNSDFATSKDFAKSQDIVQHKIYVAQYPVLKDLLNTVDNLLEFLDYLEHSKPASTTPLLYARKNILSFKLDLVKLRHQPVSVAFKQKENRPRKLPTSQVGNKPRNLKESSNKEKIFNFIKRSPNSRTKEIVEEFSILSERTVKRNLKELTEEGLLRKWSKDNGVYYSTI